MTPRGLLTTVGATALGFGIVMGGAPAISDVLAQDATPPAAETPARQESDFEARRADAYNAFVAAMAGELGSDEAAVDAAIRTALAQQVDEREAAGDLGREEAAALRAVIEVAEAPLFLGFGGPGGKHGFDGRHGRHGRDGFEGRGPRGDVDDVFDGLPDDDSSPATLPADDAADQAAPAPLPSTEDVVL